MAQAKRKKVKGGEYFPDSMSSEQSDAKFYKKGLKDKMNRAPEFNKGIAKGKRNINSATKV